MADPVLIVLLYFILPLWFAAGFADWLCHRAAKIESTAGAKESLIHLLMFGEMAVPLMALFLEINALIIVLMIVAFLSHEATALWDVSYAVTRRAVSPAPAQRPGSAMIPQLRTATGSLTWTISQMRQPATRYWAMAGGCGEEAAVAARSASR